MGRRSKSNRRYHKKVMREERRRVREGYSYPNVCEVKVTRTDARSLEELRRLAGGEEHRQV